MNGPVIYEFGKNTPYFFLSNFYPCEIVIPGDVLVYPSTEHAFQAMKTEVIEEKKHVRDALWPGAAKKLGREVTMRKGWDGMKVGVMTQLLDIKFCIPELRAMLLDTAPKMLVEGNYWHDTFWGVCFCPKHQGAGSNKLGQLLMDERREIMGNKP